MRTLEQWLALQESVHPQAIDMGLERVSRVARALDVERLSCPVITVAGTNGKGATCAHLEALLGATGLSTGLFTSPHLIRYNERIRINGREVADPQLLQVFEQIEQARATTTLTFFEYNTLAALLLFRARAVQVAILEVGLGGRLDATNLIDADVAIVCSIGFDHRDWLGDTLEQIGAEKAGIFRSGRPALLSTAHMPRSVWAAIEHTGARAVVAERDYHWQQDPGAGSWSYQGLQLPLSGLPPSALSGSIQYRNAATALAAIECLSLTVTREQAAAGLQRVHLPGRFQIVPGEIEWILDIAHNEPAAQLLAAHVREHRCGRGGRLLALSGILADKDAPAIAQALQPLVDQWILCSLPGPRGMTAEQLAARVQLPRSKLSLAGSVADGCELAAKLGRPGDCILVFGSVYTVGPALQWLGIY